MGCPQRKKDFLCLLFWKQQNLAENSFFLSPSSPPPSFLMIWSISMQKTLLFFPPSLSGLLFSFRLAKPCPSAPLKFYFKFHLLHNSPDSPLLCIFSNTVIHRPSTQLTLTCCFYCYFLETWGQVLCIFCVHSAQHWAGDKHCSQ